MLQSKYTWLCHFWRSGVGKICIIIFKIVKKKCLNLNFCTPIMRTNGKLWPKFVVESLRFGVSAPKFRVCARKFRVCNSLEEDIYIYFFLSNRLLQIYLVLFKTKHWDQVQIDHTANAFKLRNSCFNTELALAVVNFEPRLFFCTNFCILSWLLKLLSKKNSNEKRNKEDLAPQGSGFLTDPV